ncbi:MAG TPA: hypothetical protein VIF62_25230 [Labilithrix sp.]
MNSAVSQSTSPIETLPRRKTIRALFLAYIGACLLAFVPAVATPFFLDDFLHASMVEGTFPAHRSAFDLYDFVDDSDRAAMLDRGLLPWWTHPHLTIRFFRPLASALLWVDHRVFAANALPMHIHSLAWWVVAVLGARRLFARWLSPRAAMLATIIFAVSPCHAMPLGWLANREVLLSLAFGTFALGALARFRDDGRGRDAIAAFVLFALALLGGGEYALCFGGYVVAMEVVRRRDPLARRVASWLPFALPAAAYLLARARLGYGTAGSGFYSDPLHDPSAFLRKLPWRATALFADGWLTADANFLETWQKWIVAGLVVAFAIGLYVSVRRAFAKLAPERRTTSTWLALGSLFALGPVLAVVPSLRLLGIAMLGIAPTVAVVLEHAWFPDGPEERSRDANIERLVAIALGFAHFIHGPMTTFLEARQLRKDASEFGARVAWIRERTHDPTTAEIGVVRGMAPAFFAPFGVDPRGRTPARWNVLAQCGHVLVLRKDTRTFELRVAENRSIYPAGDGNLYRSDDAPLRVGDVQSASGMTATILAVGPNGPTRVSIGLDEDPSRMLWLRDDTEELREAELPEPGFGAPFDP